MSIPGWTRDNDGSVVLTMTPDDWTALLMTLGYAAGAAAKGGRQQMRREILKLVNRLNLGNPHFTPYEVEDNLN